MPKFIIRMDMGEGPDDGEPMEFADSQAACRDAQMAVAEVAKEQIPTQARSHVGIEVDDETGAAIYRAEMDFKSRNGDPTPAPDTADELPTGPRD